MAKTSGFSAGPMMVKAPGKAVKNVRSENKTI